METNEIKDLKDDEAVEVKIFNWEYKILDVGMLAKELKRSPIQLLEYLSENWRKISRDQKMYFAFLADIREYRRNPPLYCGVIIHTTNKELRTKLTEEYIYSVVEIGSSPSSWGIVISEHFPDLRPFIQKIEEKVENESRLENMLVLNYPASRIIY